MKRWLLIVLTLLAVVTIGGAGYLGMRSVRGEDSPDVQAPSTVEVTSGDVQMTVTAPGHLVNTLETTLAFKAGGALAGVYVRPGQEVKAGEMLAELDPVPLQNQVLAAQAELDAAQARLEQLQAGPSAVEWAAAELALADAEARIRELNDGPSEAGLAAAEAEIAAAWRELAALKALPDPHTLAQAQAQLERAAANLQQAQAAYDRVKDRADVGLLPQSLALQQATIEHEAARAGVEAASRRATTAELEAARARLAAAEANLAELQGGPTAAELAVAEGQKEKALAALAELAASPSAADVQQAEAAVQLTHLSLVQAEADLEAAVLTAPFDSTVLEVQASPGEMVAAGRGLIRLADRSSLEVEAKVIEEDLPLVQTGQAVELFFDAQPDAEVWGQVARIVPQRLPGDRPLYAVYVAVDDLPAGLLAGMTVDASIVIESRHDVLRLPRALVRARSDGTATVEVWTGTQSQERLVHTGLRGDTHIEILDGLDEGEEVVAQ